MWVYFYENANAAFSSLTFPPLVHIVCRIRDLDDVPQLPDIRRPTKSIGDGRVILIIAKIKTMLMRNCPQVGRVVLRRAKQSGRRSYLSLSVSPFDLGVGTQMDPLPFLALIQEEGSKKAFNISTVL